MARAAERQTSLFDRPRNTGRRLPRTRNIVGGGYVGGSGMSTSNFRQMLLSGDVSGNGWTRGILRETTASERKVMARRKSLGGAGG